MGQVFYSHAHVDSILIDDAFDSSITIDNVFNEVSLAVNIR